MGAFDKIMDMIGIGDNEFEDEELENEEDYEEYEEEEEKPEKKSFFSFGHKTEEEPEEEPEEEEKTTPFTPRRNTSYRSSYTSSKSTHSKVVSMNGKALELAVVKPYSYSDSTEIAENLSEGKAVVINMEDLKNPEAQRSIDFVCGVVYALNGSLQKITDRIFIAAPTEVSVDGDILEEIMRSGYAPNFNN